jgi:hypothetical protein
MFVAQLLEIVPVGRRASAVEQPGIADNLGTGADADDDRTLFGLAPDPLQAVGSSSRLMAGTMT